MEWNLDEQGVQPPQREARPEPWWPQALGGLLFSLMVLGGLALLIFGGRDLVDLVNPPSSSHHADGVVKSRVASR